MRRTRDILIFFLAQLALIGTGCKKLVEVTAPPTSLSSGNVYTNDATAAAVLTNIYARMSSGSLVGAGTVNSISMVTGLSGDELTVFGGASNVNSALGQFYLNNLTSATTGAGGQTIWNDCYAKIYIVNLALERLAISTTLTPSVRQQLIGEAKFLRAFLYFYLYNLYGDVPLTITSDYTVNAVLSRSTKSKVYEQIINDLVESKNLLSDGYVAADAKSNTSERLRPNKWTATALLARVYLYMGEWSKAEIESGVVIDNTAVYDTVHLEDVFLKNSKEAIWQLQPVNTGWNTEEARLFILPATGPSGNYPVFLSPQLLNSFEADDQRKIKWTDSVNSAGTYYYAWKYHSATINAAVSEYSMVLRLAEQYLIRAEARAKQENLTGAISDMNIIRRRAGLIDYAGAVDDPSVLSAILRERQVELFTEWGHRWFDLKRTGSADIIMPDVAILKGSTWNTSWQLYPIPLYDITQNSHLTQNQDY